LLNRALIEYGTRVYLHKLNPDTAPPPPSKTHGYALAVGLFLMQLSSTFFLYQVRILFFSHSIIICKCLVGNSHFSSYLCIIIFWEVLLLGHVGQCARPVGVDCSDI
jgi:hypothetical protein